jgi:CDP-diacylglycerol--glycerol-3-phosphate 3-phosphatidyltransferase
MSTLLWNSDRPLTRLRWQWALLTLASAALLWLGFSLLRAGWEVEQAARWLLGSAIVSVYPLAILWRGLQYNFRAGESQLLARLGIGNILTVLRGILIAGLAGFLFSPQPAGWAGWLPGLLYSLVTLADCFDGYLARRYDQVTRLGEMLDMSLDGLGVLAGSLLLARYGQVPAWYLLVGLARYLFVFGSWMRRRMGKPVYELAESPLRRQFAGAQMGFIAVLLFPVFSPPGTHLAAALFALPFLVGFARDWLAASGMIASGATAGQARATVGSGMTSLYSRLVRALATRREQTRWVPLVLRSISVALVIWWLSRGSLTLGTGTLLIFALAIGGAILLALGAAGRLAAVILLFSIGFSQQFLGLGTIQVWLVVAATAIFYLGTGPYSLWVPEKALLARRPGEK